MSLVAYADSDEEISDEEGESEVPSVAAKKPEIKKTEQTVSNGRKTHDLEEDEEIFDLNSSKIEDLDDDRSKSQENSSLLTSLPAPKSTVSSLDINNWVEKAPRSKNQPVKILIPSLSKLEEEEPEEPVKKKIKPSSKGSGLFALLPKPKSESSSLKLIPPSVNKKSAPLVPKQVKKPPNPAPNIQKPPNKINLDYNDSDDEDVTTEKSSDFFSLTEKPVDAAPVPVPVMDIPDLPAPIVTNGYPASATTQPQPDYTHSYYPEQGASSTSSTNDFLRFEDSSAQQSQPVTSGDYIPFNSSNIELDDDALRQLCGRKDRKVAASQLIDVRGDSLVMNSQEWLLQNLSEEKVQKSHKKNKKDGPSTVEKRKHQITYLAFQAKENELELKNTWANNRQTRKQTQSKYGF